MIWQYAQFYTGTGMQGVKNFYLYPLHLYAGLKCSISMKPILTLETSRFLYIFRLENNGGSIFYYDERGFWDNMPKPSGAFQFPYIIRQTSTGP
jgi:hypothetical protein